MELSSGDRVLALAPVAELRDLAEKVALLVGILDPDAVYEARAALRNFSNVMIVPADPEGTLPWKDEFFSVVYAPSAAEPDREMLRVLAPGGRALVAGGAVTKR